MVYIVRYITREEWHDAQTPEYKGIAKIFWSGRSQAVRLPAACRFDTSEVEVDQRGQPTHLAPTWKKLGTYFDSDSRGSLPKRREVPIDERDKIR